MAPELERKTIKHSESGHVKRLFIIFCAWKILLLLLTAFCPGPGYDTSALILFDSSELRHQNFIHLSRYDRLALNLFRWDAFYFVKAAERGYVFEQEWAFSRAYSQLLHLTSCYLPSSTTFPLRHYIVAGILLSHVFHFLSVLALYRLLSTILESQQQRHVAFIASVLHVLTPASLFYSAPYAEALFSFLNLTGMACYVQSKTGARAGAFTIQQDAYMLSSGLIFALATLVRSNGLLSGLIFLYDVATFLPRATSAQLSMHDVRKIIVTCVAGTFVALGFAGPQYLAYTEFCGPDTKDDFRPWCENSVPSIYSWVQSHYWSVGTFRYWTIPNLPLFLLAAPMLWILLSSSGTILRHRVQRPLRGRSKPEAGVTNSPSNAFHGTHNLPELALPQLMLAIAAITNFHVQIVNRIASAYPIWYAAVAMWLVDQQSISIAKKSLVRSQWFVRGMIMYALVQGMLYANFLPPA